MGRTLRESASADYALVRATIQEAVERGLDANSRAAALDALANTGDPDLAPVAVRALQAADAAVRAAAAKALGSLDSAGGGEALAGRLGAEDDPRVRTALVAGIRAMARPGEAVLQACARLCEDEPDPAARGQMARLLVDHLDRIPEARPMLERLLRRERDPATMAYVGGRLR
jgi:HEAT repeat protein